MTTPHALQALILLRQEKQEAKERHEKEAFKLDVEINILDELAKKLGFHTMNIPIEKKSIKEINEERERGVIQLLKEKGEMHAKDLGQVFGVAPESMRGWLQHRINERGVKSPWMTGQNSYYFRLREND